MRLAGLDRVNHMPLAEQASENAHPGRRSIYRLRQQVELNRYGPKNEVLSLP